MVQKKSVIFSSIVGMKDQIRLTSRLDQLIESELLPSSFLGDLKLSGSTQNQVYLEHWLR